MCISSINRYTLTLLLLASLSACGVGGGGDGNDTNNNPATTVATSTLCDKVTGNEAILWDRTNGVIRIDPVLPPPPPTPVGGSFTHPWAPLLSFTYAVNWNPMQIAENFYPPGSIFQAARIGVDLMRQDSLALWRYLYQGLLSNITARDLLDAEMARWLAFFGLQNAQAEILCTNEGTAAGTAGAVSTYSNIMLRAGEMTFIFANQATLVPGTNMYSALSKVAIAPTIEFQARALDTFLAIDWQLLIADNSNTIDSDGDGWRDGVDRYPNDPTKW